VYAELIPPVCHASPSRAHRIQGHESTFFSLFSLTDKSASFLGPAIVGVIADFTGNIRLGFVFLLIMLAVPVPVLLRVRTRRGKEEATEWTEAKAGGEQAALLSSSSDSDA
jgi:UMF1 family MFS transporter